MAVLADASRLQPPSTGVHTKGPERRHQAATVRKRSCEDRHPQQRTLWLGVPGARALLLEAPSTGDCTRALDVRRQAATIRSGDHLCDDRHSQQRRWRQQQMTTRASGVRASSGAAAVEQGGPARYQESREECLRCGALYARSDNSPTACAYHGHMTGDRGMYAYAPPHQGVDGEWSESTGVIVYVWNEEGKRPNTGRVNWKKRWTCCGVYGEDATPCRRGWHVSYSDGATRF